VSSQKSQKSSPLVSSVLPGRKASIQRTMCYRSNYIHTSSCHCTNTTIGQNDISYSDPGHKPGYNDSYSRNYSECVDDAPYHYFPQCIYVSFQKSSVFSNRYVSGQPLCCSHSWTKVRRPLLDTSYRCRTGAHMNGNIIHFLI
jgi:hypothetical protein